MRKFLCYILVIFWSAGVVFGAEPITVELTDGTSLTGEPLVGKDEGIKFKLSNGKYTDNIPWGKFNQATLKELEKNSKLTQFVTPFIELTAAEKAKKESIVVRDFDKPEQPPARAGFGKLFGSPISWVFFALIYAGNIFASTEIARYRRQSMIAVVGAAVVLPFLAPALFLAIPTRPMVTEEVVEEVQELPVEDGEAVVEEAIVEAPVETGPTEPQYPEPTVYQKGQFTFNRRFFETRFTPFTKIVSEQPDMVIDIKSLRGEYTGTRLSKIDQSVLSLQVEENGASADVEIPFIEISQIVIRHKEAPKVA